MAKQFIKTLSAYHKAISRELKRFFNRKIKQTEGQQAKKTLKLLKEFSLRPGKRSRSILINCGYFLAGGHDKKAILETSIFIELIHNFLLIHDDIIDRDNFRRGKPTIHRYYQRSSSLREPDKEHYGQSMAIVAGDLISALGYEILTNSNFANNYKILALDKLNQAIIKTGHGQMSELWLRDKKVTKEDILKIYQNKTAYYSFVAPLQIGSLLAGATHGFLKKIEELALPLGIAFQIQDDLSDIKIDAKEGQPTLFRKSGSVEYCQKIMEKLIKKAKKSLNSEKEFPQKEKQFLLDFTDFIFKR